MRQQVDRILESAQFSGSKRSQDFLRYVVEKARSGQLGCLKERAIGNALFGRTPDYDTGSDACVRVVANETRKRLQKYYSGRGHLGEPRIELAPGSYVPSFRLVDVATPSPVAFEASVSGHQPASVSSGVRFPSRRLLEALSVLALVLAAVCLLLYLENQRLHQQVGSVRSSASAPLPWSLLLAGDRSVHLILGDGSVGALQVWFKKRLSLNDYINKKFIPSSDVLSNQNPGFLDFVAENQFTTVSYASTAVKVSLFVQAYSYPMTIAFARDLSMREFRSGDHFILIGTPRANPWIDLFEEHLNFILMYDPEAREPIIRNTAPRPGEPARYVPVAGSESYGLVAFLTAAGQSGHVLIVGGTNSQATEATGEFITDIGRLRDFMGRIGVNSSDPPQAFEALLKVTHLAGLPQKCELVAYRVTGKQK